MQVKLRTENTFKKTGKKSQGSATRSTGVIDKPTDFTSILNEVLPNESSREVNLNELWSDLPSIEKNLLDHPSNQNLEEYKKLIYRIAKEILKRNVKVLKLKRKNSKGDIVKLELLEFVDLKLKKMAEIVFNPALPAFHLLKTTEDIRGLLLDYQQ